MLGLIDFIFFLIVAITVAGSVWLSRKYKERYADFPWGKAGLLIALEVVSWIICRSFWLWVRTHPWIAVVGIIILVIIFVRRKKKKEQIL